MRVKMAVIGLVVLAACSPGDTKKVDPQAAAVPSDVMKETFTRCTWGEVKGATLSLWSYACGPDAGNVHVIADDALPGFAIESTGAAGTPERRTVIQIFNKPADAAIAAILPAVRAASPETPGAACTFEPAPSGKAGLFVFGPTGELGKAWDADQFSDAVPAMPCGPLGVGPAGDRVFTVMEGHPDKVAYIDFGSEIQIFDADTLKVLPAK